MPKSTPHGTISTAEQFDVLVIGAGPTGLACAIDAQREGFRVALVDKGCLCNSLFHYPSNMTFFTTPELLEIGNIPFSSPNQKPNRAEALEYYRKVAQHYRLDVRQYENVERVGKAGPSTASAEADSGRDDKSLGEETGPHSTRVPLAQGGLSTSVAVATSARDDKSLGEEAGPRSTRVPLAQGGLSTPVAVATSARDDKSFVGASGAEFFAVHCKDAAGRPHTYQARAIVVATGYYDLPNYLGIPGEDLPKVFHYYGDPHPYYDHDVLVIGGKNSAAIAALDLWRHGARVTLVHRGEKMHRHVKYWILPDIENRIKHDEIHGHFNTTVEEIALDTVRLRTPEGERTIKNDFVFALTGYHPDFAFLESLGVRLEGDDRTPVFHPHTLESNVPGIYLAGVVCAGKRTNEIFIENGRFHGAQIAAGLRQKFPGSALK